MVPFPLVVLFLCFPFFDLFFFLTWSAPSYYGHPHFFHFCPARESLFHVFVLPSLFVETPLTGPPPPFEFPFFHQCFGLLSCAVLFVSFFLKLGSGPSCLFFFLTTFLLAFWTHPPAHLFFALYDFRHGRSSPPFVVSEIADVNLIGLSPATPSHVSRTPPQVHFCRKNCSRRGFLIYLFPK